MPASVAAAFGAIDFDVHSGMTVTDVASPPSPLVSSPRKYALVRNRACASYSVCVRVCTPVRVDHGEPIVHLVEHRMQ